MSRQKAEEAFKAAWSIVFAHNAGTATADAALEGLADCAATIRKLGRASAEQKAAYLSMIDAASAQIAKKAGAR